MAQIIHKLNNGLSVPAFGLGTWRSPKGQVQIAVKAALDAGYRHIDCAQLYQNQDEVGNGIQAFLEEEAKREKPTTREDIFVVSKVWQSDAHPDFVEASCRQTLADLNLAYLDLYLIHFPRIMKHQDDGSLFPQNADGSFIFDESVQVEDTWRAMEKLVDLGLVKSIGVSNFTVEEMDRVLAVARIKPVTNQVEVHPYWNQQELLDACTARGIIVTAYSPLGNIDASKYTPAFQDAVIAEIAVKHNKSPAQVVIRWGLQRGYLVIPKSVTAARIVENGQVFDFELSADEMSAINALGAAGSGKAVRQCNPPFGQNGQPLFTVSSL